MMLKLDTEIRREQLAQAALELIATHGIEGLSIARVAAKVGLVPSAMYRHFPTKDDLLIAVIGLIRERLHHNALAAMEVSADPFERLKHLLMAHVRLILENKGVLRVVFSEELHSGNPKRKAMVYEMISSYLKRVAAIVSEGQLKGRIRSDLNSSTVAAIFLGLIQPAAILWHMSDGEFDLKRHVERAWSIFSKAIEGV